MRSLLYSLGAFLLLLGGVALTVRVRGDEPYSPTHLRALLEAPLTGAPGETAPKQPFWRALLAHPRVRHTADGLELPLGAVQADPTRARAAALAAGELLALPALEPEGTRGPALWQVILASSATRNENGKRIVKLFGCRHSATPEGAPALEDSYHARVALAAALEQLARAAGQPIELEGLEAPAQGGANFELVYANGQQQLDVTFAGQPARRWRVTREFVTSAPADGPARTAFVAALEALAQSDASLGRLTVLGPDAAVPDGIDVRLEVLGGRLSALTPASQGQRLSAYVALEPETPR